jgi:hypothetical protein
MTTESETADRSAVPDLDRSETASPHGRARPRAREATSPQTAPETAPSPVTHGDRRDGSARLLDQLVPPEPWTHRPASLRAMARYARRGGWTGPDGPARRLGVWWYRLVAVPVTILCHYAAWIIARPARTVVLLGAWAVLMQVPALYAVAAAVLPWDPWPLPGGGR